MAIKRTKSSREIYEQMQRIVNANRGLGTQEARRRANTAYRVGIKYLQNIEKTKTYANAKNEGANRFAENHSWERFNKDFGRNMQAAGMRYAEGKQYSQRQYMGIVTG